jgi:hypothetical protein
MSPGAAPQGISLIVEPTLSGGMSVNRAWGITPLSLSSHNAELREACCWIEANIPTRSIDCKRALEESLHRRLRKWLRKRLLSHLQATAISSQS